MRPPTGPESPPMHTPPTDDEAAAILAAVEELWPKPVAATDHPARRNAPWRFSGRWWSGSVRRGRPRF